jgi:hypothetical protein
LEGTRLFSGFSGIVMPSIYSGSKSIRPLEILACQVKEITSSQKTPSRSACAVNTFIPNMMFLRIIFKHFLKH